MTRNGYGWNSGMNGVEVANHSQLEYLASSTQGNTGLMNLVNNPWFESSQVS